MMQQRRSVQCSAIVAIMLVSATVSGCSEDLAQRATECFSDVSGYTSPAPGVLTLQGHFYNTESILVRDFTTHAQVAGGTPASDRTSFTFTGVPSGSHSYEVIVSCNSGQNTLLTETFVVQ
jgi:hypothetical protein